MQVEETMVDRLQGKCKREAGIDLSSDLRVTRHGAKWHWVSLAGLKPRLLKRSMRRLKPRPFKTKSNPIPNDPNKK
jgi:hypothetical protein